MSAGRKYEYLWKDGKSYKTPVKKCAPEYVHLLMHWVAFQFEEVFPPEGGRQTSANLPFFVVIFWGFEKQYIIRTLSKRIYKSGKEYLSTSFPRLCTPVSFSF